MRGPGPVPVAIGSILSGRIAGRYNETRRMTKPAAWSSAFCRAVSPTIVGRRHGKAFLSCGLRTPTTLEFNPAQIEPVATLSDTKSASGYRGEINPRQEERVLVLDFGGQTAQLIARRIRDANVFCQLVRHDLSAPRIRELAPRGLILSGGPASIYESRAPEPDPDLRTWAFPFWGSVTGCTRPAVLREAA